MRKLFTALLMATTGLSVTGGTVRNLSMDDGAMERIRLAPGRSTILRFIEKPHKIVMGNQSHYKTEFIENDVAIRPQGFSSTNLFVYTAGGGIFGFILTTHEEGDYDDLVKIHRKHNKGRYGLKDPGEKQSPRLSTKSLALKVEKIERVGKGLLAVLLSVENNTTATIGARDIRPFVTQGGRRAFQKLYLKKHVLEGGKSMEARIVLATTDSPGTLVLNFGRKSIVLTAGGGQ